MVLKSNQVLHLIPFRKHLISGIPLPAALGAHALHFCERAQGVLALASTPGTFAVDAQRLDPGNLRDGLPGHLEKHLVLGVLV